MMWLMTKFEKSGDPKFSSLCVIYVWRIEMTFGWEKFSERTDIWVSILITITLVVGIVGEFVENTMQSVSCSKQQSPADCAAYFHSCLWQLTTTPDPTFAGPSNSSGSCVDLSDVENTLGVLLEVYVVTLSSLVW